MMLLEATIWAHTSVRIFKSFISCDKIITPANQESSVIGDYAFDFLRIIFVYESIKLAAIFTDKYLSFVCTNHQSGGILHPSMTCDANLIVIWTSHLASI